MTVGERIEQELRSLTDAEQSSQVAMNAGPFTDIEAGFPAAGSARKGMLALPTDPNIPAAPGAGGASAAPGGAPAAPAAPGAMPNAPVAPAAAAPDFSPVLAAIEAVKAEVADLADKVDGLEAPEAPAAPAQTTVVLPAESPDMTVKKVGEGEWLISKNSTPKGA
jgi:hypothetical protein